MLISHRGVPPIPRLFPADTWADLGFRAVLENVFSGPAAVIVFFVVSGFCIHYPFVDPQRQLALRPFYVRRSVRIVLPALSGFAVCWLVNASLRDLYRFILWSLIAELIYYGLYPLLRWLRNRDGSWNRLVVASYVAAVLVVLTNPRATFYPSYGDALNWILGLPCWLLGCVLAERAARRAIQPVGPARVYAFRVAVVLAVMACSMLCHRTPPVGYPWTLNVFALLVLAWLQRELGYRDTHSAPAVLEWAGKWSYSLYLMHIPFMRLPISDALARMTPLEASPLGSWGLSVLAVLVMSYAFFLVIEAPSHRLAVRLSQRAVRGGRKLNAAA